MSNRFFPLKHIKSVQFSFDPLLKESIPSRLLLSMMKSKNFIKNNPTTLINVNLKPSIDHPLVLLTFSIFFDIDDGILIFFVEDNTIMEFRDSNEKSLNGMLEKIREKSRMIDIYIP